VSPSASKNEWMWCHPHCRALYTLWIQSKKVSEVNLNNRVCVSIVCLALYLKEHSHGFTYSVEFKKTQQTKSRNRPINTKNKLVAARGEGVGG